MTAPRHAPDRGHQPLGSEAFALGDLEAFDALAGEVARAPAAWPERIVADPEHVERDLARLVLTVIELLRRLLEQQAIRRIEGGSLSDDQIERMGETFMKLDEKMSELATAFGLTRNELNLRLGSLGDLM